MVQGFQDLRFDPSHRAMAAGGYAGAGKLKFVKLSGEEIPCHLAGSTYNWVVHHSDNPWIIHEFHTGCLHGYPLVNVYITMERSIIF